MIPRLNSKYYNFLPLNKSNIKSTVISFWIGHIHFTRSIQRAFVTKRDYFSFRNGNFLFLVDDIYLASSCGVCISHLVRTALIYNTDSDLNYRNLVIMKKILVRKGYHVQILLKTFTKYYHFKDLVCNIYNI